MFLYTGEGQVGDMDFSRGNRAIREHVKDGKTLLLFEALGKGQPVRFLGEFECASFDHGSGPDRNGDNRKTIRFHLVSLGEITNLSVDGPSQTGDGSRGPSLRQLRDRAKSAAGTETNSNWKLARTIRRQRKNDIKAYILKRASGVCELTGDPAPFSNSSGQPFLEVHHIKKLSDGGLDDPVNCAAITPNAHREIHYGSHGPQLDEKLEHIIRNKEQELDELNG